MRSPLFGCCLVPFLLLVARQAHADDACFPACRSGYVCNREGRCVSECNPPCDGGMSCRAGECVASEKGTPSTAENAASSADHRFAAAAGAALFVAAETAPGLAINFRYKTPGDHAFVVGPRFLLGLPEGPDFGVLGVDAGYRGNFAKGDVQAGLLALVQPQIWVGGAAMFHAGGALGGFVQIGRVEVQLPVSIGLATLLEDPFQGRSRDLGLVVTVSLLGGIMF